MSTLEPEEVSQEENTSESEKWEWLLFMRDLMCYVMAAAIITALHVRNCLRWVTEDDVTDGEKTYVVNARKIGNTAPQEEDLPEDLPAEETSTTSVVSPRRSARLMGRKNPNSP